MTKKTWCLAATLCALASATHATDLLTQWNFNSAMPDANTSTGTLQPSVGAGVATLVGGIGGSFASGTVNGGSTDPAPADDSGWQTTAYAAQGTDDRARGVQFSVSTLGFRDIIVSWDQRHSNTSSRFVQFQYSLDGLQFTDHGGLLVGDAGDTWFNQRSVDLSMLAGVADNASFAFRIVAAFAPSSTGYQASSSTASYSPNGTWRFDMVSVQASPIPEPGSWALLVAGLSAVGFVARRRS